MIKELSVGDMRTHYLQIVRKQDPSRIYKWHLLGERTPCRILSIRTVPANMGQAVPGSGSRLLTQALVRFDTLQVRLPLPSSKCLCIILVADSGGIFETRHASAQTRSPCGRGVPRTAAPDVVQLAVGRAGRALRGPRGPLKNALVEMESEAVVSRATLRCVLMNMLSC